MCSARRGRALPVIPGNPTRHRPRVGPNGPAVRTRRPANSGATRRWSAVSRPTARVPASPTERIRCLRRHARSRSGMRVTRPVRAAEASTRVAVVSAARLRAASSRPRGSRVHPVRPRSGRSRSRGRSRTTRTSSGAGRACDPVKQRPCRVCAARSRAPLKTVPNRKRTQRPGGGRVRRRNSVRRAAGHPAVRSPGDRDRLAGITRR